MPTTTTHFFLLAKREKQIAHCHGKISVIHWKEEETFFLLDAIPLFYDRFRIVCGKRVIECVVLVKIPSTVAKFIHFSVYVTCNGNHSIVRKIYSMTFSNNFIYDLRVNIFKLNE